LRLTIGKASCRLPGLANEVLPNGFVLLGDACPCHSDKTVPAQAAHYGQLAEGLVRSRFICKGMTFEEVKTILGQELKCGMFGVANSTYNKSLGVDIAWGWRDDVRELRVSHVAWCFRAFEK